jgi:hypothetical protein
MSLLRRIPPKVVWLVGIVAALLGIFGAYSPWYAVIAGVLTAIVVTIQYMTQGNTSIPFDIADWRQNDESFEFSAGRYHGKGARPNVSVYMPTPDGAYEEVECAVRTLKSGEIVVGVSAPFAGEVRIS